MTTQSGPASAATRITGPEKPTATTPQVSSVESTDRVPADSFAEVVSIHPTRDTRLLTVRCPHCRRKHSHGLPWGDPPGLTHRVAHCQGERASRDYYVEIPGWAAELRRPAGRPFGGVR